MKKPTKQQVRDVVDGVTNILNLIGADKHHATFLIFGVLVPQLMTTFKNEQIRFGKDIDPKSAYIATVAMSRFFRLLVQANTKATDEEMLSTFKSARAIGDLLFNNLDLAEEFAKTNDDSDKEAREMIGIDDVATHFPIFGRGDA